MAFNRLAISVCNGVKEQFKHENVLPPRDNETKGSQKQKKEASEKAGDSIVDFKWQIRDAHLASSHRPKKANHILH